MMTILFVILSAASAFASGLSYKGGRKGVAITNALWSICMALIAAAYVVAA